MTGLAMALGARGRRVHATHRHDAVPLDAAASASRAEVGGKGHALAAMAGLGLPVPPAFCVTAEWCGDCAGDPAATVERVWQDVLGGVEWLEGRTARTFGRGPRPLLLAVRSSGVTSMPGMLDTLLDVGIDDAVADALADWHGAEFANDTRERFRRGYRRTVGAAGKVPDDPAAQLRSAVEAVIGSWSSPRVAAYRAHHGLRQPDGVAILLQAMVFGNLDAHSGTGVLFTRDPSTGAANPFGEWLAAAQGDDVVSGTSNCEPVGALREQTWLLGPSGAYDAEVIPEMLHRIGVPEEHQRIFQSHAAAIEEAKRGKGLAPALSFAVSQDLANGDLKRVTAGSLQAQGQWSILTLAGSQAPSAASELARFVTTPRATQAMLRGAGVTVGRFKPSIHVTLWS